MKINNIYEIVSTFFRLFPEFTLSVSNKFVACTKFVTSGQYYSVVYNASDKDIILTIDTTTHKNNWANIPATNTLDFFVGPPVITNNLDVLYYPLKSLECGKDAEAPNVSIMSYKNSTVTFSPKKAGTPIHYNALGSIAKQPSNNNFLIKPGTGVVMMIAVVNAATATRPEIRRFIVNKIV